ncbi:hypothetical protein OVA24_16670 [Luteolibacter sp. SL250]|uniref:hypothetical protein n=1 Tax=Luteolibacter sp. SL250 TaxID=2995170 RepID=UPI0022717E2D|nr:hypothetical protein [Luteolibacter sp. SL250]WAC18866.1 hypothetical protein OVA24_16670 [Luteolibacter sp. SL250]
MKMILLFLASGCCLMSCDQPAETTDRRAKAESRPAAEESATAEPARSEKGKAGAAYLALLQDFNRIDPADSRLMREILEEAKVKYRELSTPAEAQRFRDFDLAIAKAGLAKVKAEAAIKDVRRGYLPSGSAGESDALREVLDQRVREYDKLLTMSWEEFEKLPLPADE